MSYKGRTVFQSDWAKYGGYGLAFAGALSKEGYLPGLSGTIGTAGRVLDIGKILTADDRGKEISGMAGGVMGSLAGQRLLMPIIVIWQSMGDSETVIACRWICYRFRSGCYSCFYYGKYL